MDEMLKEYLKKKSDEQKEKQDREKRRLLIQEGLYRKEYSPTFSEEYCNAEWDSGMTQYFKAVPIDVDDAEYEIIKNLCNTTPKKDNSKCAIAIVLNILGAIFIIAGFTAGVYRL